MIDASRGWALKPRESAADALGWGEEPIAPARTVKSDPIVGRPDPEEQARTDTDACTETSLD